MKWFKQAIRAADARTRGGWEGFEPNKQSRFKAIDETTANKTDGGVSEGVNEGVNVGVNGLLAYIQSHPGQRAGEMAVAFKLTKRTIERWLKQLKENGKIEFRGAAKTGGYYYLDADR